MEWLPMQQMSQLWIAMTYKMVPAKLNYNTPLPKGHMMFEDVGWASTVDAVTNV